MIEIEEKEIDTTKTQRKQGRFDIRNLKELFVGGGNTFVGISEKGIWAGAKDFESAPFRVNMQGSVIGIGLSGQTITGSTITGSTISGGTITGATVTGGIIRTSSSGSRVEMSESDNTLNVYESGDRRVILGSGQIAFLGVGEVGGGTISSLGSNSIVITGGSEDVWLSSGVAAFYPGNTNALDLGGSSNRWKTVFSVNADDISSDKRQKKNIKTLKKGLNEAIKLRPVSFVRKGEKEIRLGFIAQEVERVLPEVVSIDKSGNYGIAYTELIPVLVGAIQELTEKVQKLEKIINK